MMNMCTIPGTRADMTKAEFWINKIDATDEVIMQQEQIESYNASIINSSTAMSNILKHSEFINGKELNQTITKYTLPKITMYNIKGKEIKPDDKMYYHILKNCNLKQIQEKNKVKFGIAIKNTRIRSFPTDESIFKSNDDIEFDRFQESECQALEAVAILHRSLDNEWAFIKMYNYSGWAKIKDIAISDNSDVIFQYLNAKDFIIVTGNKITTQFNHYEEQVSKKDFYMGTKIPLENHIEAEKDINHQGLAGNYIVKLPIRNEDGTLAFKDALVSAVEDVNHGYLSYTTSNVLKLAFKLQGDRYDWGNKNNGRDCSSFVMYIYKTFGIRLPRNADEQETIKGIGWEIEEKTVENCNNILSNAKPGAAIFMDGHVMLYIGKENNEHFMIHDFYRFGKFENGSIKINYNNQVAVTSVLLLTGEENGNRYIDKFRAVVQFEEKQ